MTWCYIWRFARDMYETLASAVRCDMVLHRGVSCETSLNRRVTPRLPREYICPGNRRPAPPSGGTSTTATLRCICGHSAKYTSTSVREAALVLLLVAWLLLFMLLLVLGTMDIIPDPRLHRGARPRQRLPPTTICRKPGNSPLRLHRGARPAV